jgi:hypothetical protein
MDSRWFEAGEPHAFKSPQHRRSPERSFGMLNRGDRLSPERREKTLDISAHIEGLLLSLGCLPNASSPTAVCRGGGLHKYQQRGADA